MNTFIRHRLETFSAVGVLLWGVWLLNPFVNSFERFASFGEMQKHFSENWWGMFAFLVGLVGLTGLHYGYKELRRAGMLLTFVFRSFTFVFIGLQNNFASNGTPDFFLWMMMAAFAYYRIDNEF